MAELSLPLNSRIKPNGKRYAAPAEAKRVKAFKIYRWNPDDGQNPRYDTYELDLDTTGPMVLDALIRIKGEIDPTLTFRRSCREGICGSCSMNIDGTNALACTTAIEDVKGRGADHAAAAHGRDQGPGARFQALLCAIRFDQAVAADGDAGPGRCRAHPDDRGTVEDRRAVRVHPVRLLLDGVPELLVGTATSSWGRPILLQAYRWLVDSRDEMTGERLDALEDPFRLYRCHTIMNCANVCPKGLNPAKAIAEIKKMMVERAV